MTNRLKGILVGAACLVCCIPLVLAVAGATTGVAAAVGVWFRRYDLAVLALLGLTAIVALAIRDSRAKTHQEVSSR